MRAEPNTVALRVPAVRGEHLEAVPQFAERGGEQLDVAAAGLVAQQLVGRLLDLVRVLLGSGRGVGRAVRSGLGRLGVGDRVERGVRGDGSRHVNDER